VDLKTTKIISDKKKKTNIRKKLTLSAVVPLQAKYEVPNLFIK